MIKKISRYLVDIHGQHEHQSLLNTGEHGEILDNFIGKEINKLKETVANIYYKIEDIKKQLNEIEIDEGEKARQLDMLEFQIKEIEDANLKSGEMKDLKQQFKKLSHMEDIFSITGTIYNELNGDDFENNNLIDRFGIIIKKMKTIKEYDTEIEDFYQQFKNIFYQLEDLSFQFQNYIENVEFDQNKLDKIQQRLDLIQNLQRKYGKTITEILEYQKQMINKKNKLKSQEDLKANLRKKLKTIKQKYYQKAKKLSKIRKKYSRVLEKQIKKQFKDLAMKDSILKVDFKEKKPGKNGIEKIEFLIKTNPGEDLKPLHKIASGGELSRIMLALKTIISDIDKVDTLIFDEVDSGVGGKTAQKMAEKLAKISLKRQIICITHLPQIASMADTHFLISKESKAEKTFSKIYKLNPKKQKQELARMLGGVKTTKTTLKHAQEMLKLAKDKKEALS
jgi:DNA repair protein RecN (Recombination protein N)